MIDADGKLCDMVNVYKNTVANDNNAGKLFLLLDMLQNWKTCEWFGNAIEIDDETRKFAAVDDFEVEHKFLEN